METIIVHEATTVERTFAAPTRFQAGSDQPESGPWNATMSVTATDTGDPSKVWSGSGVWIDTELPAGTYSITITPDKTPFDGRILLGAA